MKETVQQTRKRHALYGAQYRIDALQQEINQIKAAFPSIDTMGQPVSLADVLPVKKVRIRTWSAKQRAEASKRQKAIWAKRRKG